MGGPEPRIVPGGQPRCFSILFKMLATMSPGAKPKNFTIFGHKREFFSLIEVRVDRSAHRGERAWGLKGCTGWKS